MLLASPIQVVLFGEGSMHTEAPPGTHWDTSNQPSLASCRYAIDRDSDVDQVFDIDADTGAIVTGKGLDRETAGWHNITVLAMEAGGFGGVAVQKVGPILSGAGRHLGVGARSSNQANSDY